MEEWRKGEENGAKRKRRRRRVVNRGEGDMEKGGGMNVKEWDWLMVLW